MTIDNLLKQFEEEFGDDGILADYIDGKMITVAQVQDWLRTHLTKMFNKNEAFQFGFMSGYKAGRESYETQMK